MIEFKNISIRTKIILFIVVVSSVISILSSVAQYYFDKTKYKKDAVKKIKILAEIISESNPATIIFNDKMEGERYLSILNVDKYIESAVILLPDSSVFVEYKNTVDTLSKAFKIPLQKDTSIFSDEGIAVSQPIVFKEDTIGTIQIVYSLLEYKEKQKQFLFTSIIIILISGLIATILAYLLQKVITNPIINLEKIMNRISEINDYSLRSKYKAKDEIGILSSGFNLMIAQIEKQNNELKTAKDQSDEALKTKERFLANITHELRTPLNSIIGLSTLIEDTSLTAEQKEYLDNIKISSDHLLAIINDLLEFTKIGSGKFHFEKAKFSLRHTIERIEKSMQFELKNRDLEFHTSISSDLPEILIGDEFRLNQILINLIGNAIKFTPGGSIRINIHKKSETADKVIIEFNIIDTGIGISKEKQHAIFESFTQESSNTDRKYGGTGLGLTITKQLIELQEGTIWVESEKNKGSNFSFYLPFDKKLKSDDVENEVENLDGKGHKVMIIDDNNLNLMFTKSILEKNNFDVCTFAHGNEALEKLKTELFDIILLDLQMPDLDGYEICRIIRSNETSKMRKNIIVALTAAATKSEIEKCFNYGMDDFIIKPFKKNELIRKLLHLISVNKEL